MNTLIELLKSLLFGIVEGVTEWLPISSTGHLILLNELVRLNVSDEFWSMFEVVIQLGAILAVIVLFFHKLNPFAPSKSAGQKKETWILWLKVILSIIPSGLVGILLDDWMDAHLHTPTVVAAARLQDNPLSKTDLFRDGLTGCPDSSARRDALCHRIGLPAGMTSGALLAALRMLMTYDEYLALVGREREE